MVLCMRQVHKPVSDYDIQISWTENSEREETKIVKNTQTKPSIYLHVNNISLVTHMCRVR